MDINAIILELLSRIKVLEDRVNMAEGKIEELIASRSPFSDRPDFPIDRISKKYKRLAEYLYNDWGNSISLTYDEIEDILGFTLPDTARNIPASYWANTRTHSYATSWLNVGYKAKVHFDTLTVTFIKQNQP